MAVATPDDVKSRLGRDFEYGEEVLVRIRLNDGERMIVRRALKSNKPFAELNQDDVIQVEADVVLRIVRNPEGYIQESDGNYSYMLPTSGAANGLFITDDEWEILGLHDNKIFTIRGYLLEDLTPVNTNNPNIWNAYFADPSHGGM